MSNNPFLKIDKQILADAGTSDECSRNLHRLCDQIGPRFAGTPSYRRAAEFMLGTFRQYKLDDPQLEAFDITAWRRGEPGELTMTEPFNRSYPCYTLPYSVSTAPYAVEAGVVDIGAGAQADIDANKKKIKGNFILTTSAGAHRTAICTKCKELGAVGFILIGRTEGMMLPTGSVASEEADSMPAVGIGYESGLEIQRLAKQKNLLFTLNTDATFEKAPTWNVLGEITGTEFPDELVFMGGHLDSHEIGPGAFDNAAGAVQVMEAARLLAKHRKHLKRTVRFIGFAAEEIGLLGSHYYTKKHSKELRKARFMLNSDCPQQGSPKGLGFHRCPKAAPYIEILSKQMDTEIPCQDRFHCHSDHYPFILKGVPTAGMASGQFGLAINNYCHMAADTVDKIAISSLRDGAAFAARMLLRAANDEEWPNMRRSPAQVKKLLADN